MFFKLKATCLKIASFFLLRDTTFDWKMPCMLRGLFVQRVTVSSFQKYCKVHFELSNAYLHVGNIKHYLTKWRAICSRKVTCCKKEYVYFLVTECYSFEWNCLFVKPALVNQNCLQKNDAWLIVFCNNLQYVHCLFKFGGKNESWDSFCWLIHSSLLKWIFAERWRY